MANQVFPNESPHGPIVAFPCQLHVTTPVIDVLDCCSATLDGDGIIVRASVPRSRKLLDRMVSTLMLASCHNIGGPAHIANAIVFSNEAQQLLDALAIPGSGRRAGEFIVVLL